MTKNNRSIFLLGVMTPLLMACSQSPLETEQAEPNVSETPPPSTQLRQPLCEFSSQSREAGFYHFAFPEVQMADLVKVQGYWVHRLAAEPLTQMINAARAQGVNVKIASAFRSVAHQQGIIQRKKKAGLSPKQIYFFSAPAGFSEHHTGLAIDFHPIQLGFVHSPAYRWLRAHAEEYGFVQTFTQSYSAVTGVSEEAWHWKYFGHPEAKTLLANGECYNLPATQWKIK